MIPVIITRSVADTLLKDTMRPVTHLHPSLVVEDVRTKVLRERVTNDSDDFEEVVVLFGEQRLYRADTPLKVVYDECRDEDGFLYVQYLT